MNVVELAAELIRIPSVNPAGQEIGTNQFGEAAMAGRIKALLRGFGATEVVTTYPLDGRPNVIGYFDLGAPKTILFEAHMDTVPVEGMTIAPFGGDVRDGKLWGRGACDEKGPMAAMLTAIAEVSADKGSRFNIIFAALCDEESGFSGIRHMLDNFRPEWKQNLRFAIVAEPTDLHPVAAHKGVVRWHLTTRGVAAHSSTPELGRNAIYEMARAITQIEAYGSALRQRPGHAKLGAPSLSVGTISGGTVVNIVPESCTAHIDRRLVPGENPQTALDELRELLKEFPDIEVSAPTVAAPPFEVPDDCQPVRACIHAAGVAGHIASPHYGNYCTHASFYGGHGIQAAVFGPGSMKQAHTADEWISVEALEQGARAYREILTHSPDPENDRDHD